MSGAVQSLDIPKKYQPRTVRSVSRAVSVMRVLRASSAPLTLSAITRHIDLSPAAVSNILDTLRAEGLVERDASGCFLLGRGLYEMAAAVPSARELHPMMHPDIHALAKSVPGAVLLSVAHDGGVLYVDRDLGDPEFSTIATVGFRSPMHATASGKVLLAHLDETRMHRELSRPLAAATNATVTEPQVLMQQLCQVREQGFATCWGEHEPSLSSIAVPIIDRFGSVRAALAVAVRTEALDRTPPSRLLQRLRSTAQEAGRRL